MQTQKEDLLDASSPRALARYQRADLAKSLWQVANSFIPYVALWVLMVKSLSVSYWLTLGLAVVAAGFLIRIFIIFHDCGHGSFFRSRRANDLMGFIAGVFTLTPNHQWWHEHAVHHATAGDLDRRGVGDVWTLTVEEYRSASRWTRLIYWFFRNPFFMLIVGPFLMFVVVNRFPHAGGGRREKMSVLWTNLAVAGVITVLCLTIGWKAYLLVHLPVFLFSGSAGIWLFYVQHQFEGVYWKHHEDWDYVRTAMEGSSYFHLPRLMQWFSGNIGFHHIHHLNSRIPNYRLEACHRENPVFQKAHTITFLTSFRTLGLRLWDDEAGKLVGFSAARRAVPVEPPVPVSS